MNRYEIFDSFALGALWLSMAVSKRTELIKIYTTEVLEALLPLAHSWEKLKNEELSSLKQKSLDDFEPWEALISRFARTTDIFLSKYIRLMVLEEDPGFRGEMRDLLDKAEKISLISNADQWMQIRELRNQIAHEYTKDDLLKTFKDILTLTPFVLNELKGLKN